MRPADKGEATQESKDRVAPTVDERTRTVTHHIQGHLDPKRIGIDNVHTSELAGEGDELGEPIVLGFGILFVIGTVLIALGAYRRTLNFILLGSAILLAIGGAWTLGILGAAIGLLPLLFLKRRHTGTT